MSAEFRRAILLAEPPAAGAGSTMVGFGRGGELTPQCQFKFTSSNIKARWQGLVLRLRLKIFMRNLE